MQQNQNSVPQLHQLHSRAQQSDHAGPHTSQSRSITPGGSIGWPCLIGHPRQVLQFCGFVEHWFGLFFGSCCWRALLKRVLSWSLDRVGRRTGSIPGVDRRGMGGASHVCILMQGPGLSPHSAHRFPLAESLSVPSPSSPCQPEPAQTPQHRLWGLWTLVSASSLLAETHLAPGKADTHWKVLPRQVFLPKEVWVCSWLFIKMEDAPCRLWDYQL